MELELVYNEETQEWEEKPEPFITIECETEEDFEFIGTAVAFYKKHIEEQGKPQTYADRIRAMSDEEFAEVLGELVHCGGCPMRDNCNVDDLPCNNVMLEWLKQPAEEDRR